MRVEEIGRKGGRTLSKEDDGGHQSEEAERAPDLKELSDAFLDVRERPSDVHSREQGGKDSGDARQKQGGAVRERTVQGFGKVRGCFLIRCYNQLTWLRLCALPTL